MKDLLAPLKNALSERIFCTEEEFIGLFAAEGGVVLARVRRAEEGLLVRLSFERAGGEDLGTSEALASLTEMALLRLGWDAPLALCLPEEAAFVQLVDMPEEVADWREAAYWEADGALAEGGLSRESIYWSALRLETGAAVAALERGRAQELKAAFSRHGLTLSALYCVTPAVLGIEASADGYEAGGRKLRLAGAGLPLELARPALFAALAALGEGEASWPLSFLGTGAGRLDYGALLTFLFTLVLFFSLSVLAFEGTALYAAKGAHEEARGALTELRDAQKEMRLAAKIEAETESREQELLPLSRGALPMKSVLVHLGSLRAEGVQLTELSLGEGALELAGKAAGFEALADLTDALGTLPGFRVTDAASKADESGEGLDFTLRLEKK